MVQLNMTAARLDRWIFRNSELRTLWNSPRRRSRPLCPPQNASTANWRPSLRDPQTPIARRLEAAKAAGPFLHARLCAVEPKLSTAVAEPSSEKSSILV
jgi:hypothetical protein